MELLDDSSSDSEGGGVALSRDPSTKFKVNEQYARKFEYNKRREELRRCEMTFTHIVNDYILRPSLVEDTLGDSRKRKRTTANDTTGATTEDSSPTSSEDEDDAGELATEELDSEIQSTLDAIRSKDPRVYDKNTTFYGNLDTKVAGDGESRKPSKPVFLRDYHREKLLNGDLNDEVDTSEQAPTYYQEQEALKTSIIGEINAAAADHSASDGEISENDFDFLPKKPNNTKTSVPMQVPLKEENGDQDPETFLSNFMSSRAWVPTAESRFQPFESDDEEEERRAEEFEDAYNFRFEDPERANEKLVSYARDPDNKYSVRRSKETTRARRREAETAKKEAARREREEGKARLKRLRVDDLHDKVRKIRRAAGLKDESIDDQDFAKLVNGDWDDSQWHAEMQKRFDDRYYADADFETGGEEKDQMNKKRKPRRPKWEDDIEIDDIVPDFQEQADLSSSNETGLDEGLSPTSQKIKSSGKQRDKRKKQQRDARRDRRKIEQLVDHQLDLEPSLANPFSKRGGRFQYRDTSPVNFGLTPRDILMAEDRQLNSYAGIKKLASFRDVDKKRKDRKRLGKKAHLQDWRKEVFGDKNGTTADMSAVPAPQVANGPEVVNSGVDVKEGKRKRKRAKKKKARIEES